MKVSVSVITYNHEQFIAKALDSVLMQQTDFPFEIVIGEDCSTDATRDILLSYREKHPDRIRLLLHEVNVGAHTNSEQTLGACRGQYVALLEGDDYWTSPNKLQKQVDFLDANPDYSMCFHNATYVYTDGSREPEDVYPADQEDIFTIERLLEGNFIPNCSTMFRNGLFEMPEWFHSVRMTDWPHHILCATKGKIGYLPEVMAVHLFHPAGVWFSFSQSWLKDAIARIEVYDRLQGCLEPRYRKIIDRVVPGLCLRVAEKAEGLGDFATAKRYARRCLTCHLPALMNDRLARILLRLHAPKVYRLLRSIKRGASSLGARAE